MHSLMRSAPSECTIQKLNFGHCIDCLSSSFTTCLFKEKGNTSQAANTIYEVVTNYGEGGGGGGLLNGKGGGRVLPLRKGGGGGGGEVLAMMKMGHKKF